jgi:hypothetical protein
MKCTKTKLCAIGLARTWWHQNIIFRGDHTRGMFMSARDYVDIVNLARDSHPVDYTGTAIEEEAIRILTTIAQRYIDESNKEAEVKK